MAGDATWRSTLGVEPGEEEISADDFVKEIRYPVGDSDEVVLTWDVTDDSVRVRYLRGDTLVVDLYREGATLLTAAMDQGVRVVVIECDRSGLIGRTRVSLEPVVAVTDSLLFA